jgi:hypothetical protein
MEYRIVWEDGRRVLGADEVVALVSYGFRALGGGDCASGSV